MAIKCMQLVAGVYIFIDSLNKMSPDTFKRHSIGMLIGFLLILM